MYRANLRGRFIVVTLISGVLLAGGFWAAVQPGSDPFELRFGGDGRGFQTQGPSDFAETVLDIVTVMADEYVERLDVAQEFHTLDGSVKTPLLSASVHSEPGQPNTTVIVVDDTRIELAGILDQVPPVDVDEVIGNLSEGGWLPPLDDEDDEPSDPEPEPDPQQEAVFWLGDDNHTYGYIMIHDDDGTVELILLQTPEFGGLRIVANPWFIEHSDSDGKLIDLWVRNPFHAIELGNDESANQEVECEKGKCKGKKEKENCRAKKSDCKGRGKHQTEASDEGGHVNDQPGTILHVWANDSLHAGAGISILEKHEAALAGPTWQGNPFTSEGLWVEHEGGLVARLHIDLPRPDHPGLGITVAGPVVEGLTGAPVSHDADLSEFEIDLNFGPVSVSHQTLYEHFGAANAVLVGTWRDTDGEVQSLSLTHLATGEPLIALVPDGEGGIAISAGPLGVQIDEEGVRLEPAPDPFTGPVDEPTAPLSTAIAALRDAATGEVRGELRVILDSAGCEGTPRGCVAVVYDAATTTIDGATGALPDGAPGVPPLGGTPDIPGDAPRLPDVNVDNVTIPDTERYVQWLNARAGTVLGYVPEPGSCPGLTSLDVDQCIADTPGPLEVVGAVVGLIGEPGNGIAALPTLDTADDTIHLRDGEGYTLLRITDGTLTVAGASAAWNDDAFTVRAPDGQTVCVQHTLAPPAPGEGHLPSLTVACDGLGGKHHTIQPGASYQVTPDGELTTLALYDPADPGAYLLYYHNDGTTTTISSAVTPLGTIQVPSTLAHITGNPVTSSTFQIMLAGESVDVQGSFDELTVTKQLYQDGRALLSTLPAGSALEVAFAGLDAPERQVRVDDGLRHVKTFSGTTWTSGLRDHTVTVTTPERDAPERLDVIYSVTTTPEHGTSPQTQLVLVGADTKTGTRTYSGTIAASAFQSAPDGATLKFALAWTDHMGPLATTQWDDNGGEYHRYKLDMKGPLAKIQNPAQSDSSIFGVSWNANHDTGSGLAKFVIDTSEGVTAGAEGWITWIDGRSADAEREASYPGTPGATHWFRAQACDTAGNCGPWTAASWTRVAEVAEAAPEPTASLAIDQPAPDAVLSGVTALAWHIDYDGDATPITNIHYKAAGATKWTSVTSTEDHKAAWDTRDLLDGAYLLRFELTDGARVWEEVRAVTLTNGNHAPDLDDLRDAAQDETRKVQGDPDQPAPAGNDNDNGKGQSKESPPIGLAVVVLGLLGLLAFVRRRP